MLIQSIQSEGKHEPAEQNHNTVRLSEFSDSNHTVRIHWSGAAGGETGRTNNNLCILAQIGMEIQKKMTSLAAGFTLCGANTSSMEQCILASH
eukprot:14912966-Heterocapsa_arctica.AAC.1